MVYEPNVRDRAAGRPRGLFAGFLERARQRRDARVAAHRLRDLDDHMLRDMGIHRGDIEAMVRGR